MDEQQESTFLLRPRKQMFKISPIFLYLATLAIGTISSMYYPRAIYIMQKVYGVQGFPLVLPDL